MRPNPILPFPLLFLFIFSLTVVEAQFYENASDNLPTNGASSQSMDVQVADLDGDNDLDIVVANEFQANTILINDGNAVFTNGTFGNLPPIVHDSEDVAIADYDMDGDLDLIFCSEDDLVHEYYLNDGMASFNSHPSFQFANSKANAVISIDINSDSIPDVLFGNAGQNALYLNNGDGTFTNATLDRLPSINDTTQDINAEDVDQDGDLDLFVGNENGNRLLINNGTGFFSDETLDRLPQGLNIETRKVTFGDINGDDAPDVFLSNVRFIPGMNRQNRLFVNDGNGFFTDVTQNQLPNDNDDTLDAIFEDVDDDGDLDLVIANVNLQVSATQKIYLNDGTGIFTIAPVDILGSWYLGNALGVINADLNNDGLKDLYFCDRNTGGNNKDLLFLKNSTTAIETAILKPQSNVQIIPNPAQTYCTLTFDTAIIEQPTIMLLDSTGKRLSELSIHRESNRKFTLSLGHKKLVGGNYFIQITSNGQQWVEQLLIKN